MTGGQSNPLVTAGGTNQQSIIVPLQFFFLSQYGTRLLPLIALQYSEIKFKFTWGTGDNASRMVPVPHLVRYGHSIFTLILKSAEDSHRFPMNIL